MMIRVKIVTIVQRKRDRDPGQNLQIVKKKTLHGAKRKRNVPMHHHLHCHLSSIRDRKENTVKSINPENRKNQR